MSGRRNGSEQTLRRLARAIDDEVIPRLVLAHRSPTTRGIDPAAATLVPRPSDVSDLAGLLLEVDDDPARRLVASIHARGVTVETLYLDLLAPAARRLGELWLDDRCDFTQVTIGLCRLQHVLHELEPEFRAEVDHHEHGRRVLLVPVQSEQHTFGVSMVAEFFRRAGWDVSMPARASAKDIGELVRSEWFSVVGFSAGCEQRLDVLASGIRTVRRASRNRDVGVLVGGPMFVEHPELTALVGADATGRDGRDAAFQAESLLTLLSRR